MFEKHWLYPVADRYYFERRRREFNPQHHPYYMDKYWYNRRAFRAGLFNSKP